MKKRYCLYKNGFVKEDGGVIDPVLYDTTEDESKIGLMLISVPMSILQDCHTVTEEFDGVYWCSVEGTENYSLEYPKTMTAMQLCSIHDCSIFTVGNSKVEWESIVWRNNDKCQISRLVEAHEGGKPAMLGLNYKTRYIEPETIVNIKKWTS